ncbi:hypothetical protein E5288_WYG004979 [Bos mutus]|uniref:Protein cornichon-like protein 4 n=1 Tax=Bos mutus TaxID=72004 RepID=A0A6B0R3C2_9CETA|nr:hypothetical protein [Bos mutus]
MRQHWHLAFPYGPRGRGSRFTSFLALEREGSRFVLQLPCARALRLMSGVRRARAHVPGAVSRGRSRAELGGDDLAPLVILWATPPLPAPLFSRVLELVGNLSHPQVDSFQKRVKCFFHDAVLLVKVRYQGSGAWKCIDRYSDLKGSMNVDINHPKLEILAQILEKRWVIPELVGHTLVTVLMLISLHWFIFLLNLPVAAWNIYRYIMVPSGNMGVFDPTEIHNRGQLKSHMKEAMIKLGFHLLCFFMYLYRTKKAQ